MSAKDFAKGPFVAGDVCDDRYRIVRALKAGGVGVVYQAEHVFTGMTVALKALYNLAGDHHERMRMEARALAEIRHPNVVRITDGGVTSSGVVWFTMELLRGQTLRESLFRDGGLDFDRALDFGIQMADGVAAAHALGVIHRDLKPENVFVVEPGDTIRVLDFGTSKFRRGQLKTTDRFRLIGTHAYMSPERLQADSADARADIYSLGHILYEMITGMHCLSEGPGPLDFPPAYELGIRQIYAPPAALTKHRPDTPDYISEIVLRALAKDRAERQPSMLVLRDELGRARERLARERPRSESRPVSPARSTREAHSEPHDALTTEPIPASRRPDARAVPRDPKATLPAAVALARELVCGAVRFADASLDSPPSPIESALVSLLAREGAGRTSAEVIERAVYAASRADQKQLELLRRHLGDWSDAARTAMDRLVASWASGPAGESPDVANAFKALGAARLLPQARRLDAVESALVALTRAPEDVRIFATSVLIAIARAERVAVARARGALLALLLGGPQDTELAHAELAEFVLRAADAPPLAILRPEAVATRAEPTPAHAPPLAPAAAPDARAGVPEPALLASAPARETGLPAQQSVGGSERRVTFMALGAALAVSSLVAASAFWFDSRGDASSDMPATESEVRSNAEREPAPPAPVPAPEPEPTQDPGPGSEPAAPQPPIRAAALPNPRSEPATKSTAASTPKVAPSKKPASPADPSPRPIFDHEPEAPSPKAPAPKPSPATARPKVESAPALPGSGLD